jgi:F0F1-type ATP synthase assembly protein I
MVDEHPEPSFRGRDLAGVGGMLVGAVVLGMLLGVWYDDASGNSPTGVLVGVALGVVLGCSAAVLKVRSALRH